MPEIISIHGNLAISTNHRKMRGILDFPEIVVRKHLLLGNGFHAFKTTKSQLLMSIQVYQKLLDTSDTVASVTMRTKL